MSALFALMGSGEFEPWTAEVDRWLLERATGDGGVLILPTASAAEGDEVFDRWARMGMDHYAELGIPAKVIPVKTREDADDPAFPGSVSEASMAFFSGGNPAHLAGVLAGSRLWSAILEGLDRGLAYAGCSAGVACLGEVAPDSASGGISSRLWRPGLNLFPGTYFGPHWDMLDTFVPGLRDFIVAAVPPGQRLVGIDERTALVGDGTDWSVVGAAGVHLMEDGAWRDATSGASLTLPLRPS